MSKDLLFEIGLEEVPARFVRDAMEQLGKRMADWLTQSRIAYGALRTYATPRRLAVLVEAVSESSSDQTQEVRGPSRQVAIDEQGEWSKAAQGFARSQGVSIEELNIKDVNGTDYVFATKLTKGEDTASLLSEGLLKIIHSIHFAKPMRWGDHDVRFIRPIRWLVALFGEQIIPLTIAKVNADRFSQGHRFLGGGVKVAITTPDNYVAQLKEHYVYVDVDERKSLIISQIEQLAAEKDWTVSIEEELLEEVLFLVEYPSALSGNFAAEYLHIPQEVLITSMREHQRYFPVLDEQGKLLPHFVTVRNGDQTSLDLITKGNEKVLHARLSDAAFFYDEDLKLSLDDAVAQLDKVVFHDRLGSIGSKVKRIEQLAYKLGQQLSFEADKMDKIARTASLCKFDLVTQMVNEFPELQGTMGEYYALHAGEDTAVARAINEHYEPRFSGDCSPSSLIAAIVSIADKIDTIVGCFMIGIVPTGSQDPYALRRQAAGIVQILHDHHLVYSLEQLFKQALAIYEQQGHTLDDYSEVISQLQQFFQLRLEHLLTQQQLRHDVVSALLASQTDDIHALVERGQVLMQSLGEPEFKRVIESFVRTINLAAKATADHINPSLFENDAERQLHDVVLSVEQSYKQHTAQGDSKLGLEQLATLQQPIDAFFDQVMVMAEDEQVKHNRLALLARITSLLNQFAAFQHIIS